MASRDDRIGQIGMRQSISETDEQNVPKPNRVLPPFPQPQEKQKPLDVVLRAIEGLRKDFHEFVENFPEYLKKIADNYKPIEIPVEVEVAREVPIPLERSIVMHGGKKYWGWRLARKPRTILGHKQLEGYGLKEELLEAKQIEGE